MSDVDGASQRRDTRESTLRRERSSSSFVPETPVQTRSRVKTEPDEEIMPTIKRSRSSSLSEPATPVRPRSRVKNEPDEDTKSTAPQLIPFYNDVDTLHLAHLIDETEKQVPGARDAIEKTLAEYSTVYTANKLTREHCFLLHHFCRGQAREFAELDDEYKASHVSNQSYCRKLKDHQSMKGCGHCVAHDRHCDVVEHVGSESEVCTYCEEREALCLRGEHLEPIYSFMKSVCPMHRVLNSYDCVATFIQRPTEEKINYLTQICNDFLDGKTTPKDHPRSPKPCQLHSTRRAAKHGSPRREIVLWCDCPIRHLYTIQHFNVMRMQHLLHAIQLKDDKLKSDALSQRKQVSHRCKPVKGGYCWEWTHTTMEPNDKNFWRDYMCFPGKEVCRCIPHCLDNGPWFVLNIGPTLSQYAFWKPDPDKQQPLLQSNRSSSALSTASRLVQSRMHEQRTLRVAQIFRAAAPGFLYGNPIVIEDDIGTTPLGGISDSEIIEIDD